MKRTYSDEYPTIRRLQAAILYPHDVREEMRTDEDGAERNGYSYEMLRVTDRGQQIENAELFAMENYAELRRNLYASAGEQLDMQYHGTWDAHISEVKASFPKPE